MARNKNGTVVLKTTGKTGVPPGGGTPGRKSPLAVSGPSAPTIKPTKNRVVGKNEASK